MNATNTFGTMVYNFNAGPSILPQEVFQQASEAILNFNGTGLSLLEIGHRTRLFEPVLEEAIALVKNLMHLGADHDVLFLHGGATTQFMQIPMNLLEEGATAAYLDGGIWGTKAIHAAKQFGNAHIAASSKDKMYSYIPKELDLPANASYFHYTTNNTVEGTQMHHIPATSLPLIADMSSDILSRKMDFNRFDIIYAGAQKNIGAAGTTLVVVNKNVLGKINRVIPSIMDYRLHIQNASMLNTPPVFAIYVCMLNLRWLQAQGGIAAMETLNAKKSKLLYSTLDKLPQFIPTVATEDRSDMNVVFTMDTPANEERFKQLCKQNSIVGIEGHRSAGGFRASLYNALPISSVQVLCDIMEEFSAIS